LLQAELVWNTCQEWKVSPEPREENARMIALSEGIANVFQTIFLSFPTSPVLNRRAAEEVKELQKR
jgi:hypothetical protein